MDDLLDNFAGQSLDSPTELDYKYHFVNGSPAGSEHARSIHAAPAPSTGSGTHDPTFVNGTSASRPAASSVDEDEANYNADDDDDDDDDDYDEPRHAGYKGNLANEIAYNKNPLFEDDTNDTNDLDRSLHNHDFKAFSVHSANSRARVGNPGPSPYPSNDEKDRLEGFAHSLRRFHRQDTERDELLTELLRENLDLKRTLKDSVPGGNPRAEAAERSLFEIRKTLDRNPFVCVLIDGNGYKIHEDLLQSGQRGGTEAANRLWTGVSNYLQQVSDAKPWEIMVHFYMDVGSLLARFIRADIPMSDRDVFDFMVGFTKSQPLFTIVDVGYDAEKLSRKMEDMFHLFVNNAQCKHVIFGCCHNKAYAVPLELYASNPITASSITLLKSYEDSPYFDGLPFDSVRFPHVFRSTPFKTTDRLREDFDHTQAFLPHSASDGNQEGLIKLD